jgi:hypothetical protein
MINANINKLSPENEQWVLEALGSFVFNSDKSGWFETLLKAWGGGKDMQEQIGNLYNIEALDWSESYYFPVWVAKGTAVRFDIPDTPKGTPIDCEVTSGAGVVIFLEAGKFIASDYLSTAPGETFFIRLNTNPEKRNEKWEAWIIGTGEGEKVVSKVGRKKIKSKYPANQFKFSVVLEGTDAPISYHLVNVNSNDILNIRSEAGTTNKVIGKIPPNGKGVLITGAETQVGKATWVQITYNGISGWVNKRFLEGEK